MKEICILLGGTIELESEVGKGSKFTVRLPWSIEVMPRIDSEIDQTIDEFTKQQRVDFARANETPTPTVEDIESVESMSAQQEPPQPPISPESNPAISTQQINPQ